MAKRISQYLVEAYPGHPWHVAITGGLLVIKHMNISANMGACLHYRRVLGDESTLRKGVVFAGGELLERAGLSRGRAIEGDIVLHADGIPDKHLVMH